MAPFKLSFPPLSRSFAEFVRLYGSVGEKGEKRGNWNANCDSNAIFFVPQAKILMEKLTIGVAGVIGLPNNR